MRRDLSQLFRTVRDTSQRRWWTMSDVEAGYQRVTQAILEQLEAGVVPWRKPWTADGEAPRPLGHRRPYQGINRLILSCARFSCPLWVTAARAEGRGWAPRENEKPWPLITYVPGSRSTFMPRPRTKVSDVYNLLQLEGPKWRPASRSECPNVPSHAPIIAAERFVAGVPNPPKISEDYDSAFYRPDRDLIGLPSRDRFDSIEEYYSTLFHELVHSTGHKSRLDRWGSKQMLDTSLERYSFEELVAEIGCQFLCLETGLQAPTLANSVAYIASWANRLGRHQTWVIQAAPQAERAARWLLGGTASSSRGSRHEAS
ncbi:MAG: DUF1738 domain-containing protein [Myxococcales bacterium]|nr:DUF1738 domain-containing protein [Myxococcales bacterium]